MSAGIPGFGLGGLFFILSALLAPAIELVRTARGRSSLDAWRRVGRQFAIAVAMIIAVNLSLRGALLAISLTGAGEGASDRGLFVLPVALIGITGALLATVLGTAKALELCLRARERGWPRVSVPAASLGNRIVPGTAALATAWLALLLFGAAELNPLSGGGGLSAPESAIADKRGGMDGRGPVAGAITGASGIPGVVAGHVAPLSGKAAESVGAPVGTISGAASARPAQRPEGSGGDAVATEAPLDDVSPAPAPEAPTGEEPSGPREPPSESGGSEPGPPAHAGAPGHAGPPAHAGARSGA